MSKLFIHSKERQQYEYLMAKAGFTRATSARLRSRAMLHFEVVWLDCAATVEKSVLPDDNFQFVLMKILPKKANVA
jgi:hypothetical protein